MTFHEWQIVWVQEELRDLIAETIIEQFNDPTMMLHTDHSHDYIVRACVNNAIARATKSMQDLNEGNDQ